MHLHLAINCTFRTKNVSFATDSQREKKNKIFLKSVDLTPCLWQNAITH